MKKINLAILVLVLIASYSCKEVKKEIKEVSKELEFETNEVDIETINISMEPKSNSDVKGEVTFTEENNMVKMIATFSGLSEGEHAIHLHEKADCSSADGKSSGGHWNPTKEPHGKWGAEEGYHKGDIGNFKADADGNATVEFSSEQWCLSCEDENKNILGKAVIIHQGQDDFTSQPSGNAGARISCSAIIK
ncbi:superoxide dismutase family protein [Aurantibacter crassamenti]|uniref:superoxide dismutase family protein n=1 Tax=Aurantibacter crassamenti TaxID=1837375 RepID=UPI00193AB50B|nr:superoxide dismutase family protein [Aurantibacter crassamenti]MBM1105891.1 superoxide dismutase family protein [Aurantibacter crassamenti]